MKHVYLVLNWIFGVIFLLWGLLVLIVSPRTGLCLIIIAALLLPPVRDYFYSKTKKELPANVRAVSIFVLFILFVVFMGQYGVKVKQEQEENIEYFNANREQIISSVKTALSSKEYQSVISQSNKYLASGDEELKQMNLLAITEIEEKKEQERLQQEEEENKKKAQELYEVVKQVPASDVDKNAEMYGQLVRLAPDNQLYKSKYEHYSKIQKRKNTVELHFSSWDGSHNAVTKYIKQNMNDPDSYEHDNTVYSDKGNYLIVTTQFRGKNAFGGIVRNTVVSKVDLDGNLLAIDWN